MNKKLTLLCTASDRARVQGLLEALQKRGFRLSEDGKSGPVLLILSAAFAADESAQERFFAADSAGRAIIPLDLDGAAQPDLVRSALIAKNAITARGRTAEELAERVASAPCFAQKKSPLPKLLLAAALVLALGAGLWLWRQSAPQEEAPPTPEPTAATPSLERFGLSEEDLNVISGAILIGDKLYTYTIDELRRPQLPEWRDYAYDSWDENGEHIYSSEDGREIALTHYADLGVFALMPKLSNLTLIEVETDNMPSLAGLKLLETVQIHSCRLGGCEWLAGARLRNLVIVHSDISDFSPLGSCSNLVSADFELSAAGECDFSGFAPQRLQRLWIDNCAGGSLDLSALGACGGLSELYLRNLPIENIDFAAAKRNLYSVSLCGLPRLRDVSALSSAAHLENLSILDCASLTDLSGLGSVNAPTEEVYFGNENLSVSIGSCGSLRDISALGDIRLLTELELRDNRSLRDYTPIGRCRDLQRLAIQSDTLRDVSFLSGLPALYDIQLELDTLQNVDFLGDLGSGSAINLKLQGEVADYSGLAAVERYNGLILIPEDRTLERALAYLQDTAEIRNLELFQFKPSDWALVPRPSQSLRIGGSGELRDLSGMPDWEIKNFTLILSDLPNLRSLNGLEALRGLDAGNCSLEIEDCPLLGDLSALGGASLRSLSISRALIVPELKDLRLSNLCLENIAELEDLSCLGGLDDTQSCAFRLVGLERLTNLAPLRRFHGSRLVVPPQLAEQAEELVREGLFESWEVAYPEGGWQPNELEVTLESLDELDTMPKALLRHVTRLTLAGDRVIGPDEDVWSFENWGRNGELIPMLHDERSGEETPMGRGELRDLTRLSELTGLEELVLWNQPLESLEGIETLSSLRSLKIRYCSELTDLSPAFTLQELEELSLGYVSADSIRGVQNLTRLRRIEIACLPIADFSPLEGMESLDELQIEGEEDSTLWADALEGTQVRQLTIFHSSFDSESFARFVRQHPELKVLWMPWNEGIDDLTVLLELPELETVDISYSMEEAVKSLEGKELPFELIVEQPN